MLWKDDPQKKLLHRDYHSTVSGSRNFSTNGILLSDSALKRFLTLNQREEILWMDDPFTVCNISLEHMRCPFFSNQLHYCCDSIAFHKLHLSVKATSPLLSIWHFSIFPFEDMKNKSVNISPSLNVAFLELFHCLHSIQTEMSIETQCFSLICLSSLISKREL